MRNFKQSAGFGDVDLDEDSTYEHLPKTEKELDDLMFKEIGYALVYMNYFPDRKHMFPKDDEQRYRVQALIEVFSRERHIHYGDVKWLREQVFLFQDEIENMC